MKSKMQSTKTLTKIIRQPSIAKLITQLDELGYDLYIKPKPLRYAPKAINQALAESLKKEAKNDSTRKESAAKDKAKS